MKMLSLTLLCLFSSLVFAASATIGFDFKDAEITDVIKQYSKASGEKFILDPQIRGKVTIINPGQVTIEEAFNQLSSALAVNGLAISRQGDQMVVQSARMIQRSLIDVGPTLPPLKPEKMFMWTVQLKNINAEDVNRQLRVLTSKDGELVPFTTTNQMVITDWVSNLYRVQKLMNELDHPPVGKIPPSVTTAGKKGTKPTTPAKTE